MSEQTFSAVRRQALLQAMDQLVQFVKDRNCWTSERELRASFPWSSETVTEIVHELGIRPLGILVGRVMGEWVFYPSGVSHRRITETGRIVKDDPTIQNVKPRGPLRCQ